MGRFYTFVLGLVLGFVLYHTVVTYHLVYANDGFHLIAKSPPRFAEAYVDVRQFGAAEWLKHPELVLAINQSGQQQILGEAVERGVGDLVNEQLEKILPPAQPAPAE